VSLDTDISGQCGVLGTLGSSYLVMQYDIPKEQSPHFQNGHMTESHIELLKLYASTQLYQSLLLVG
jgi:hypothetical protein